MFLFIVSYQILKASSILLSVHMFVCIPPTQVPVPNMPSPLTTFDLLVKKDETLPLVCLGVYRHHSRRGRAEERYRLHLVDLNSPSPTFLTDVHLSQSAEPPATSFGS
ncbi:unnamed protein product, partial [Dibothriocephalus latus]